MVKLTSTVFRMRIDREFIDQLDFIIKHSYSHQIYTTNTQVIKDLVKKEYDSLINKSFVDTK